MKKRLLIIGLVLFAMLMLLPSMSFATTTYTDWTDATKLPTKAGAYKLTCDVNITSTQTVGAFSGSATTVTLDLNGHTVKVNGYSVYYYVQNTGTLIIEDSVGTGLMTNAGASSNSSVIYVKGNFQLNGGTIENAIASGVALYVQNGDKKPATCTINGGTIKNSFDKSGKAVSIGSNVTFTMNDGKIENNAAGTNGTVAAIDGGASTSKIIIAGGTIESKGTGIKNSGSPIEITGGTIEADWFALETRYATINPAEGKTVNISAGEAILKPYSAPAEGDGNKIIGGNFDAPALASTTGDTTNVELYGGTYTNNNVPMDLTNHLDGATVDPNGKVTCSHKETYQQGLEPATCTKEGRNPDIVCANCKEIVTVGTKIEKEPHTYGDWVVDKEATCTEKGSKHRECTCGDKVTEEIDVIAHAYENGKCKVCGVAEKVEAEKKDETPKTGSVDVVLIASAIVAVISFAGIVLSKKHSK